jgi:putative ABC transport system permease protein
MISNVLTFTLALRNLTRRRARTILTLLGVAIAIAFTVTILSITQGLESSFENSIAKQGADIVIVPKEAEAYPYPDVAAFVGSFPEELLEDIEQIDNVKATFPVFTAIPMDFMPDKPGAIPILFGVTPEYFPEVASYLSIEKGRFINPEDEYTLVAGSGLAAVAELNLGSMLEFRGQAYEVVGILASSGSMDDAMLYAPLESLQETYAKDGQLTYVPVKVVDITKAEETANRISSQWSDVISAQTQKSMVDKFSDLLGIMDAANAGLSAVALLIGILFILSTMMMAVGERVKEIGTMRAIGIHKGFIFRMVVSESLITSLVAGLIGCLAGYGMSLGITRILTDFFGLSYFSPIVSLDIFLIGIGIALGVGILAGLFPAWRISRTNIVQALHYE